MRPTFLLAALVLVTTCNAHAADPSRFADFPLRRWWRAAANARTRTEVKMLHRRVGFPLIALSAFALLLRPGLSADDHGGTHASGGAQMSEVNFPVSCSPESQRRFNHAVWTLHSFWYEEALKEFTAISDAEPRCAMAYWGAAMSQWYPLWYPPSPATLKSGLEAVEKGLAASPPTDREQAYLEAIARFYRDSDKHDHATRALAYGDGMKQVYERFPADKEAAIFYSLALNATWPPTDKTYANLRQAAAILERAWAEQPDHPGVVHYLIHSYDVPAMAHDGLAAARRYAAIAPAVPHAQHMPSHIFTRLGLWEESIQSNLVGHAAAKAYAEKTFGPGGYDQETVHTLDYLAYAYLQTAQDRAAKGVVDEIASLKSGATPNLPIAYAIAAIPARYALERRDWPGAAALTRTAVNFPLERFPWAAAMTSFTRALGAAHGGDLATARAEMANLQSFRDALVAAKNQYWANQVEVQRLGAAAVLAHVEGDGARAAELSRAAAELEDSMDKHPATPGMLFPAHELRADLLLAQHDAAGALKEYQAVLRTDPNRFQSVLGTARAAKLAGDAAAAAEWYRHVIALAAKADTDRPELAEAKRFLKQ